MKRLITISLPLLFISFSLFAQNNVKEETSFLISRIEKLQHIKDWRTDLLNKENFSSVNVMLQDASHKLNKTVITQNGFLLTEALNQQWNGSAWTDQSKDTYTYDTNHNLITDLRQTNSGSGLGNDERTTYTHDSNNNVIEQLGESWMNSAWGNNYKDILTYDGNNNNITKTTQGL